MVLNRILTDLSKWSDKTEKDQSIEESFIGAASLLYFYNKPEEDERIRKLFKSNQHIAKYFFSARGYGFGWVYNRPNPHLWAEMIDSLNSLSTAKKSSQKIYIVNTEKEHSINDTLDNIFSLAMDTSALAKRMTLDHMRPLKTIYDEITLEKSKRLHKRSRRME
jgi:hypothetical protein